MLVTILENEMNTTELKKLAEAASLTGAQLVDMCIDDFEDAQRLKQRFRQINPAEILKLLAINAELVDALKAAKMPLDLYNAYGWPDRDGVRGKVKTALAKAEGGEL